MSLLISCYFEELKLDFNKLVFYISIKRPGIFMIKEPPTEINIRHEDSVECTVFIRLSLGFVRFELKKVRQTRCSDNIILYLSISI